MAYNGIEKRAASSPWFTPTAGIDLAVREQPARRPLC
jgi:hypothetical protein